MSDTEAGEPDIIEHLSVGRKLRLMPSAEVKRPRPGLDPELKELLNGPRRQPKAESEDDAPEAA